MQNAPADRGVEDGGRIYRIRPRPYDRAYDPLLRSLGIDLGVAALGVPFVDDIVDLFDVALGIELHLADHRIPRTGLDRIHDFLRIGGASLRHRLRPDLHRGISIERVAFGI